MTDPLKLYVAGQPKPVQRATLLEFSHPDARAALEPRPYRLSVSVAVLRRAADPLIEEWIGDMQGETDSQHLWTPTERRVAAMNWPLIDELWCSTDWIAAFLMETGLVQDALNALLTHLPHTRRSTWLDVPDVLRINTIAEFEGKCRSTDT